MPTKDLTGTVAIVTGSNTGIGKETATAFCEMGAHVVLACRGVLKAQACAEEMTRECKGTAEAMCLGESTSQTSQTTCSLFPWRFPDLTTMWV